MIHESEICDAIKQIKSKVIQINFHGEIDLLVPKIGAVEGLQKK